MWVLHCRDVAAQRAKISSWFHSPELTSFTPAASHSFSPSHPPFPSLPTLCLHYVSPSEVLTPCRAVPALLASMSAFNEAWAGVRGRRAAPYWNWSRACQQGSKWVTPEMLLSICNNFIIFTAIHFDLAWRTHTLAAAETHMTDWGGVLDGSCLCLA